MLWQELHDKFSSRFEKTETCWNWTAALSKAGYGQIGYKKVVYYAHRIMWEIVNQEIIPAGMNILHSCDNPRCVNPDHLRLGTHKENMQDMHNRGRAYKAFGEQSGAAKLTEKEVIEIRELYKTGEYSTRTLGKRYNVSHRNIVDVVNRKIWSHI